MKTFEDLKFGTMQKLNRREASMTFNNNYAIVVVERCKPDPRAGQYEVWVHKKSTSLGEGTAPCDALLCMNPTEVTTAMSRVQQIRC
ncbi:hypothetical protein [uncultured Alistipes sp.]|jgi:hypothetical protein|uniref:hypothetical protein n=1 Tax=uncultured Alistipes sp. TaxID=538949 RepID=UPI0025FC43C5|nr:hypothetical protein [uncultured Alistipes sp.]